MDDIHLCKIVDSSLIYLDNNRFKLSKILIVNITTIEASIMSIKACEKIITSYPLFN